jgi:hypothetical protein
MKKRSKVKQAALHSISSGFLIWWCWGRMYFSPVVVEGNGTPVR